MPSARTQYLARVLDAIEHEECRLLVWGVVDGSFDENELIAIIDAKIDAELGTGNEQFLDARAVLGALQSQGLLVRVDNGADPAGYRSRMAETARLLLRLRQLFPKHDRRPAGWLDAPNLVADFRFQRRRREYPRRDISASTALGRLRTAFDEPVVLAAIRTLLRPNDTAFKLAEFQVRAAERILHAIKTDQPLATIVCAGTGSGKTLAFYLPALGSIARHLRSVDARPWVKAVALYPRTELLKDQFREVVARALDLRQTSVNVRVGALFADTPNRAEDCKWPTLGADRVCPTLRCPQCNGDMLWLENDRSRGIERLQCRQCSLDLGDSTVLLTRRAMKEAPPDILFTTTEMLNQRLADSNFRHLFGVGPKARRAPELVLIDEAHTYSGRHGAQVAYLMRRWQYLLDRPLRFVGLSATLREADTFFASLCGIRLPWVQEISARAEEIESEGAEYFVALRGDPVSRTALLSTTIQTSMLVGRCLDPRGTTLSDGLYGQRAFVFIDNLDVTNRLYFDLLSAEGRNSNRRPDFTRAPNGGLAALRSSRNSLARYRGGQDWRACERLGHRLSERLQVDRVSSQDRGFDTEADIVVATAALEVGFDDPLAGAVIQHKAPRGSASFLQRRGRAGRVRGMRPWTIVVLSDYGRDRAAYQAYDQLFDPQIAARSLPLSNRTIRRMQAVYALLDFLGRRLENSTPGSVWMDLAHGNNNAQRKSQLLKELVALLESESGAERFQKYLQEALRLPLDEIEALLWEFPRPLLTVVIPTAVRRLISDWTAHGQRESDFQIRNNPLPEFIPATLFSELNLAEVVIGFPGTAQGNHRPEEVMSVLAVLREFAPGRISRRFGSRFRTERYWIAPSASMPFGSANRLNLDQIGQHASIGTFEMWRSGNTTPIQVYRPLRLTPSIPPANIADSSNARPVWHTQLVPLGEPIWLPVPAGSAWEATIARVGIYTHSKQAPIEVRRFTTGSIAEIGLGSGNRVRAESEFEYEGRVVGLGISFPADAIVVELRVPENLGVKSLTSTSKGRALRTARFLDRAWRGEVLAGVPNPFLREWLSQVFLSAITYEAIQQRTDLRTASEAVRKDTASIRLQNVLSALFQSQIIESDGQEITLDGEDRLRQELQALLSQAAIVGELHNSASVLWEPADSDWDDWLRRVYESTMAAGVLRAIGDLCPTLDTEDLVVDLGRGPSSAGTTSQPASYAQEVWISERSPGGNGHIEEFLRVYAEDPRRFFSTVRAALEVSEFETIDAQLNRLTELMLNDAKPSNVRECVHRFRSAASHAEMSRIFKELRLELVREGFLVFHGFLTALGTRILRRGTGPATDSFVAQAMRRWSSEESRLGVEIDLRVMAYCLGQSGEIDDVAHEVGLPAAQDLGPWRASAIYGLLWARGKQTRHSELQLRNPFADLPQIERLLVIDSLQENRLVVSVEDDQWFEKVAAYLSDGKLVTLTSAEGRGELLARALSFLITNPIDSGYLRSFARLQRFRNAEGALEVDVELAEAIQ
jgi:hypothetical protein